MKTFVIYMNSMLQSGGIERVVSNLCNHLSKDYKVTILTKDVAKSFYPLNSEIKFQTLNIPANLSMKKSKLFRAFQVQKSFFVTHKRLKKKLKELSADYIYVVHVYNALEVLFAKKKENLIISEHGSYFGYNKIYTLLKKIAYPKAYKLIVPSTMDTAVYKKLKYPVVYIPHHKTFSVGEKIADVQNNHIVLNVGRYTDDKRQLLLLEIWNEIVRTNKNNDWKLVLVGSGENEEKLSTYIHEQKLETSVELKKPTERISEEYLKSGIFVFTSRFEGFGMVLLEAMSFGLPCISFDCPSGPRDVVQDNSNGFLIQNNNVKLFGEKLVELMDNSELRLKFQKNAIKTINNWDNDKITNIWKVILQ